MLNLQNTLVALGGVFLLGAAPPAVRFVEVGDFVSFSETIESTASEPWYQGSSTFTYRGMAVEVRDKISTVRLNKIERRWNGLGAGKRPDVSCMPYTDEHNTRFSSKYGNFCVGEMMLVPTKVLLVDAE